MSPQSSKIKLVRWCTAYLTNRIKALSDCPICNPKLRAELKQAAEGEVAEKYEATLTEKVKRDMRGRIFVQYKLDVCTELEKERLERERDRGYNQAGKDHSRIDVIA